ncbi:MAG: hypothetical protein SF029_18325 [bacterium]|nr:hypothetical protein [bacterium]
MNEQSYRKLKQLRAALAALADSMERSLNWSIQRGTGGVSARSYRGLQASIAQLLPDDVYITQGLVLELPEDASDSLHFSTTLMLVKQLNAYLRELIKDLDAQFTSEQNPTTIRDLKRKLAEMTGELEDDED